jgi:hypothetical protein
VLPAAILSLLKLCAAELRATAERFTVCVLPELLLSVKVRVPVSGPGACGVTVTLTVQLASGAKDEDPVGQLLDCIAKSPGATAILLMVNGAVPMLLSVTGIAALVAFTIGFTNCIDAGSRLATGPVELTPSETAELVWLPVKFASPAYSAVRLFDPTPSSKEL